MYGTDGMEGLAYILSAFACLHILPLLTVMVRIMKSYSSYFSPSLYKDFTKICYWMPRPIQTNILVYTVAEYPGNQNPLLRAELLDTLNQMYPSEFRSYIFAKLSQAERESILIDERQRRRTFLDHWPHGDTISGMQMAHAGFYYLGQADLVQCVFCHGKCSGWTHGQTAMGRHREQYPFCRFAPSALCGNTDSTSLLQGGLKKFMVFNPQWQELFRLDITAASRRLGINPVLPDNKDFATEPARRETFNNWPWRNRVSGESLADAGFYYTNNEDLVRCYYCAGGIRDWRHGDDPWEEHARWFPDCSFLLLRKGRAYVREVLDRTDANKKFSMTDQEAMKDICHDLGHARETIDRAIANNGGPFEHISDLVDVLHELEENEDVEPSVTHQQAADVLVEPVINVSASNPSEQAELGMCKVCRVTAACMIALPCGHLVYCEHCAERICQETTNNGGIAHCPVCAKELTGTFRCFLV